MTSLSPSIGASGKPGQSWRMDWSRRPFLSAVVDEIERTWPGVKIAWCAGVTKRTIRPLTGEFVVVDHKVGRWMVGEPHRPPYRPRGVLVQKTPWGVPYDFFWPLIGPNNEYIEVDRRIIVALDRMHMKHRGAVKQANLDRQRAIVRRQRDTLRQKLREVYPLARSAAFEMGKATLTREDWRPGFDRRILKTERRYAERETEVPA